MALQKRNGLDLQITNKPGKTKYFREAAEHMNIFYHFNLNSRKQHFISIFLFVSFFLKRKQIPLTRNMFSQQGIFSDT